MSGIAYLWPGEGQQVILVWSQATQVAEGKLRGCKCGGWESVQARSPGWCGQWEDPVCSSQFAAAQKALTWRWLSLPGCLLQARRATQPFTSQHLGFFTVRHDSTMTPEQPRAGLSAVQ